MKLTDRVMNWIYSTWIGDLYFKYLVWLDSKDDKSNIRYLTPGEAATIIREYSLVAEGVIKVKGKVNKLVSAKSKEEYHRVLNEIENMVLLASDPADEDPARAQFANVIRQMAVKKGNRDIVTPQDKLNMIHQRIEDYNELHAHINKRTLMRQLRKAKQNNDLEEVKRLELEFQEKYGQRH